MLCIYSAALLPPCCRSDTCRWVTFALVTLAHADNRSPSIHFKRTFNVPREKADRRTTGRGSWEGRWVGVVGPICALTQVFPRWQLWYQRGDRDQLTSARAHQLPPGEKVNKKKKKKHETDKYHPAAFDRCCRLGDCNKLGPHLDLQFYTVSKFVFIGNSCGQ